MEMRGPILVVTSLSLLVSAGVLRHFQKQREELTPEAVETVAARRASCEARGLDTPFGRLGCDAEAQDQTVWQKRTRAGGALFISGGGGRD